MPLAVAQKAVIDKASRPAITREFSSIKKNWVSQLWLQRKNRYKNNPIEIIRDVEKNIKTQNDAHLRQYIAASSLTHCMDGWSFIGRAIEAHLRGDSDTSRHLGYYAELRASMSLLASEGIGIFDKTHYIVDRNGRCQRIPISLGTHQITWDALEYWSSLNSALDRLFSVIRPGGIPLTEWLDNFIVGRGFRSTLASTWLQKWGLDLRMLSKDRNSRNFASYRPTAFTSPRALKIKDTLNVVNEFWNTFEPSEYSIFENLDRYLLRNSLETYFRASHPQGKSYKQDSQKYKLNIVNMLHNLAPRGLTSEQWLSFFTGPAHSKCAILSDAEGKVGPKDQSHHRQVLARAAVLLRIATGSCYELLNPLTLSDKVNIKFWCSRIGEDRALWQAGDEPEQYIDLWTDIREALEVIDHWNANPTTRPNSHYPLWKASSDVVSMLGSCERVCLWGVGL